jgi:hypothetical protein
MSINKTTHSPLALRDATLRNARGRALEISHAEYSDTPEEIT